MPNKLLPGETEIDTWTVIYSSPAGDRFNGKLTVTNKRLLYVAQYNITARGMLDELMFTQWGTQGFLTIDKNDIISVEVEKSFFSKKVILILANGSRHTFNYGMLGVNKLVRAILLIDKRIHPVLHLMIKLCAI